MTPFSYRSRAKEFNEAFNKQLAADIALERAELISPRNVQRFSHGRNWRTKPSDHGDEDGELAEHSYELFAHFDDAMTHDIRKLVLARRKMVAGLMTEFKRTLFAAIGNSTEKSGNIITRAPDQTPAESFLAALEMIEFGVDDNGEVSMPQIHMGREAFEKTLASLEAQGPEFIARVEQLKAEKSAQAKQFEQERLARYPSPWES
ncbi:hypothetical protein N7E02_08220 [Aliirhizobium terrae]|uniref:hypothetical protein n=1 Tax=Terrirhizobium terrae TaxID=2926709 RepID=UPI002574AD69|nr:hypothetical protein [Rhizobium sp. CC-CFT758]WJH40590.1 hypothetical protein N7E02_08220 [Rhizobium sp. CC-CFT758]